MKDFTEAFVKGRQKKAKSTLNDLLSRAHSVSEASPLHFQCLVSKLLKTTDDVGAFQDKVILASPEDASKIIKKYHAVQYHFPTQTYRFASIAHRIAAEQWRREHPEIDKACAAVAGMSGRSGK